MPRKPESKPWGRSIGWKPEPTPKDTRPALLLTWKKEPDETGLVRVGQAMRGWDIRTDGRELAHARPMLRNREVAGWYFYGWDDALSVPLENTAHSPVATPEEALAQAERHLLKHLSATYRLVIRRPRGMGKPVTAEETSP